MAEIHSVGPFILGKSLGSGASGKVKLGFHKDTGFKVAVKIISKEFLSSRPSMRKKVEREVVIMKLIDHPHVLRLYDVYETSKYLFLMLEYVEGGELFDYLVSKGSMSPPEALKFFQQIIAGLDHCHSYTICHRDLKPENLLIDNNLNIKVADFGMAALMKKGSLLQTSCGSPHYASPEVVSGSRYSGTGADIWSCGVILFALLTGKLPFDDDNIPKLLAKVKCGKFSMPKFIHEHAQDLINRMLTVDPNDRITMRQIKEHPWYNADKTHPEHFQIPVLIENMNVAPIDDPSQIDDEIFRSLKSLGLGTEAELHVMLLSKKSNNALVFYRLLENRKANQESNFIPNLSKMGPAMEGAKIPERGRSNSLKSDDPKPHRRQARGTFASTSVAQLPSSPLAPRRSPMSQSDGIVFPPESPTLEQDHEPEAGSSYQSRRQLNTTPGQPASLSPVYARPGKSGHSPPPSPGKDRRAPSSPINIRQLHRMKLNEPTNAPGSPIIGSNPRKSWFSNFFTGSPAGSTPDFFTLQTKKEGVDLAAEIQRTLSALKTSWKLREDKYIALLKRPDDGTPISFLVELLSGRVIITLTNQDFLPEDFSYLCSEFSSEVKL